MKSGPKDKKGVPVQAIANSTSYKRYLQVMYQKARKTKNKKYALES